MFCSANHLRLFIINLSLNDVTQKEIICLNVLVHWFKQITLLSYI